LWSPLWRRRRISDDSLAVEGRADRGPGGGDQRDRQAQYAQGIFWLVLPSLAFFLVFPAAVKGGFGFWPALSFGVLATLACYAALLGVDRYFRLDLFN
jgi:hypothetical protein